MAAKEFKPYESPADTAAAIAALKLRVAELEAMRAPTQSNSANVETFAGTETFDVLDEKGAPTGKMIEEDVWYLPIDLPFGGDKDCSVKINGHPFYAGQTYKVRTSTLRSLKDAIFRSWKHEAEIHGQNESPYRKETRVTFNSKDYQ